MKYHASSFGDFRCTHCHNIVTVARTVSGVNNRNHCPYCLWSCHLDLYVAGDRLSACKGQMKPRGLTLKKSRNKYRLESGGELMLMNVFNKSLSLGYSIRSVCEDQGITILNAEDMEIVYTRLYGAKIPITL